MNRLQLLRILKRNNCISFKRSPSFEQSIVAKIMAVIGGGFFVMYLILYGTMFAFIAAQDDEPSLMIVFMPLLLLIDFGIRFVVQQIPSMMVKPYLLLPLPRKSIVETFLFSSVFGSYNLLWITFFLPYVYVVWMGGCESWLAFSLLLSGMLLVMSNGLLTLLVRTLALRSVFWYLLPFVLYGSYFATLFYIDNNSALEHFADAVVEFGRTPWFLLFTIVLFSIVYLINMRVQLTFVYDEIANDKKNGGNSTKIHSMHLFDNYGVMGEFLKLEIKTIVRNKLPHTRFITGLVLFCIFSGLIAYTSIYDGTLMLNFLCNYCFALYGTISLVKIMDFEGNYIDLLMVQRENILKLLTAKYYLHCVVLLVPFVVMIPAVIAGKLSLLMMLAYMFFTSGPIYFMLFQLAVYNKQTLALNQKVTGKGTTENGLQLIFSMSSLFLPVILISLLFVVFKENIAYLFLLSLGLTFTVINPLWLKNIYKRMMKHKYENLEGFHASRL